MLRNCKYMIHRLYCSYSNKNIQNCSKDADDLVDVSQIKVYRYENGGKKDKLVLCKDIRVANQI